jgi:hypothetical protein
MGASDLKIKQPVGKPVTFTSHFAQYRPHIVRSWQFAGQTKVSFKPTGQSHGL